jgi:MFS family permease
MGQRERKRRKQSVTAPGYERSRERDEQIRAALPPLAPGERPRAVTVAAVVAVLIAIAVVVGAVTGNDLSDKGGSYAGAAFIAGMLLVAAWGMWRARYWAVLGFEALLLFEMLTATLALTVASNWWAALVCVAVIGLSGWLFYKLIRAMARLQMPERGRAGSNP